MDASTLRYSLILLSTFVFTGATYQTPNFTVTAPTAEIAEQVGRAAEEYRRDLAIFWLERPLPNWSRPCTLRVRPGTMGAGGETKFQFAGGEVLNWSMYVQGSMERILDSVLPHEVNHTIFACHFRRPLPRWADEGAATLFEHRSEQVKQLGLLNQIIKSDREFISLRNLLTMTEYPKGYRPMLILYAEGYALADFLVQQGGRQRYLKFLADGERLGWPEAIKTNYHHGGVESLQTNWRSWVLAGMPKLRVPDGQMLADSGDRPPGAAWRPAILDEYPNTATVRLQSPDTTAVAVNVSERSGRHRSPTMTTQRDAMSSSLFVGMPGRRPPQGQRLPQPQRPIQRPTERPTELFAASAHQAQAAAAHRNASFEAPRPRALSSSGARTSSLTNAEPSAETSTSRRDDRFHQLRPAGTTPRPGFEPTQLKQASGSASGFLQRKHLSQERKMVTGSTPQWAGFPGQKELF